MGNIENINQNIDPKINQEYNIGGIPGYIDREAKWSGSDEDFSETYKNALEQYTRNACDEIMEKIDNKYYFVKRKNA